MDAVELCVLPRLPLARRRDRRIQRQVHGQPVRAARQFLSDPRRPQPGDLSQFLPRHRPVADDRHPPRKRQLSPLRPEERSTQRTRRDAKERQERATDACWVFKGWRATAAFIGGAGSLTVTLLNMLFPWSCFFLCVLRV